ncbi:MAG: hypothetical protein V7K47_26300 [Nostoc sp.]
MIDPQPLTPLKELLAQVSALIVNISQHPDYKSLVSKGYQPDLNLADAHTAIVYLLWEVAPPPLDEIEVNHE